MILSKMDTLISHSNVCFYCLKGFEVIIQPILPVIPTLKIPFSRMAPFEFLSPPYHSNNANPVVVFRQKIQFH